MRYGLDGSPVPSSMKLRCLKVSQNTLTRYLQSIEDFKLWCRQKRKSFSDRNLDMAVNSYISFLHSSDQELTVASYLIYGLQLLQCNVPKEQFLVVSKQSLSGWRRQEPGGMRVPVPEEFVFDCGLLALEEERGDIAMALALQYDGYLRPSEVLGLTTRHIQAPAGRRYSKWGVIVAPSSLQETTKTGKSDDSVLLGDRPHNSWLGQCLELYMKGVDNMLFPDLNLHGFENWCKRACEVLQYQSTCIMPHVIRHSGASNDAFHGRRPLQEIQKRGRWAAKASVTRYEKHALLLASWRQCATSRKQLVQRRSQSFPSALVKFLRQNG